MKITESKLRNLIRNVIAESMHEDHNEDGHEFDDYDYNPANDPYNPNPELEKGFSVSLPARDHKSPEDMLSTMTISRKSEECRRHGLDPTSCTDMELLRAMKDKM
jgi:hypothetical protein